MISDTIPLRSLTAKQLKQYATDRATATKRPLARVLSDTKAMAKLGASVPASYLTLGAFTAASILITVLGT